jgi:Na+/melibiose symporter-like transporter
MSADPQRLSWPRLAAYGGLALPLSTIGLPLQIYLAPVYAGDLGLSLSLIGTAMLLGRFSDVITDPLIGLASDRWRTRIGRRKPWVLLGVPVLAASTWLLFNPPSHSLWLFLAALSATYLGFTMVSLPHLAWGAELSNRYEERNRIASTRQVFSIAGLLVSTAVPYWVMTRPGSDSGDVLHALGITMLILLPIFGAIVMFFVPEPKVTSPEARLDIKRTLRQLWRNPPFRKLNIMLLFGYIAETFRITITLFFARDIIGLTNVGAIYAMYFAVGFVCVPLWSWLGNRIGKHRALALAFAIVAATTLAIFTLDKGQVTLFTVLFLGKGVCFGALELLPASMVADTADVDSVMSRARRQGQMFAVSHMVVKFGQALGQFFSLNLLALVGYQASGANTPEALDWLRIFYCVGPPLVLAVLVPLLWNYPLTATRHRRFQKFVDARF